VQARSRTTSGLRSLSVGRIKEIEVHLPDIPAQRQIVRSVREFRSSFQRVRETQEITAKELDAMMPAILDRAFRGEL
jgi:type I restriction enzyme S subunit